jgi:hypothetical protein
MRREKLVETDCSLDISDDINSVTEVFKALRLKTRDACTMLVELVFPKRLVVACIIFPVLLHVIQNLRLSSSLEDLCDV